MPSEGNFLVADAAGQLDSAGLTDGSGPSAQVAFGGMMTLLGTNVTPVTDDTVGPTSTITAMAPNPAKVTTPVTVNASFADPTVDGGPNDVTAAELLIDGDVTTVTPGSAATADHAGPDRHRHGHRLVRPELGPAHDPDPGQAPDLRARSGLDRQLGPGHLRAAEPRGHRRHHVGAGRPSDADQRDG